LEEEFFEVSISNRDGPSKGQSPSVLPAPLDLGIGSCNHEDGASGNFSLNNDRSLDQQDETRIQRQPTLEIPIQGQGMSIAEANALGRMKEFCAKLLKTLAPHLLQEVESVSAL
jgi:hypothetical protein